MIVCIELDASESQHGSSVIGRELWEADLRSFTSNCEYDEREHEGR